MQGDGNHDDLDSSPLGSSWLQSSSQRDGQSLSFGVRSPPSIFMSQSQGDTVCWPSTAPQGLEATSSSSFVSGYLPDANAGLKNLGMRS